MLSYNKMYTAVVAYIAVFIGLKCVRKHWLLDCILIIMPKLRRRRDSNVELSRVGISGMNRIRY